MNPRVCITLYSPVILFDRRKANKLYDLKYIVFSNFISKLEFTTSLSKLAFHIVLVYFYLSENHVLPKFVSVGLTSHFAKKIIAEPIGSAQ
jgi:hypothetical protein